MHPIFVTGINYWPARKAMYWWKFYDPEEVRRDFALLKLYGIQMVRLFLTWEDFQPAPDLVDAHCLNDLIRTADLAYENQLQIMPTFFCGHMSGVNWIPDWALHHIEQVRRFPVFSQGRLSHRLIRNWYHDQMITEAQLFQITEVCRALTGHPAVRVYDLGNESSNCCIPAERKQGREWLKLMCDCILDHHPGSDVTLGMHAEDLEENRNIWPQDAACCCDFLCMHGYPFYLSWVPPEDVYVLPFLGIMTAWLGNKPVLFQEFGAPSQTDTVIERFDRAVPTPIWTEEQAERYYQQAVRLLWEAGMLGVYGWCYADYHHDLYLYPPLSENTHERYFGLTRWDGSVKPALRMLGSTREIPVRKTSVPEWLEGEDKDHFYDQPQFNLSRLFAQYKNQIDKGVIQ